MSLLQWQMHCGDALTVLKTMPEQSVQCVVTSPPYYALRDYGVAGQIGLEASPEDYVSALVAVGTALAEVLRDDGVWWLNLGDSYTSMLRSGRNESPGVGAKQELAPVRHKVKWGTGGGTNFWWRVPAFGMELKPKDLMGMPWRVAFALQASGWYLRSDVIWAKPNPMPESVRDRPTKAHEYLFLLTKSERYWYDADAIRLPVTESMLQQIAQGYDGAGLKDYAGAGVQNPSSVKARIIEKKRAVRPGIDHTGNQGTGGIPFNATQGANARTVWTINTEPSPYEHFAVMPRQLARRCIMAGCPSGGTVLDPFAGVATTGVVALEEGRNFVGIELNEKYHAMARERLNNVAPLLAQEVPA